MATVRTDWEFLRDSLEGTVRQILLKRGLLSDANVRPVANLLVSCIRSGRGFDFERNEGLRDDSDTIEGLILGARAAINSARTG